MRSVKRWMVVIPIALATIDMARGGENSSTVDAAAGEAAVARAQMAVQQAQAERALWTSAEEALRRAQSALREGNIALAVEQAGIAQKHAELGIAQKNYPLFR